MQMHHVVAVMKQHSSNSPVLNFVIRPIRFAAEEDAAFEYGLIDLLIASIIITIIVISRFTARCYIEAVPNHTKCPKPWGGSTTAEGEWKRYIYRTLCKYIDIYTHIYRLALSYSFTLQLPSHLVASNRIPILLFLLIPPIHFRKRMCAMALARITPTIFLLWRFRRRKLSLFPARSRPE